MWFDKIILTSMLALIPLCAVAAAFPYGERGCMYEGSTDAQKMPHGRGVWWCKDGRGYRGQFNHGSFHGLGEYAVPYQKGIMLEPFSVGSTKLRGMMLKGMYRNGVAHGPHQVFQNNRYLFNIEFDNGRISAVRALTP